MLLIVRYMKLPDFEHLSGHVSIMVKALLYIIVHDKKTGIIFRLIM